MRNLDIHHLVHTPIPLSRASTLSYSKIAQIAGVPLIYALSTSPTTLTLHATPLSPFSSPLSWACVDLTPFLAPSDTPVGLTVDATGVDAVVVALRRGTILSVTDGVGEVVGEVVDDDVARSGVLSLSASPDGALHVVVSPVKVTVMTTEWEVVGEVEVVRGGDAVVAERACVSWRGDGAFFVVGMEDCKGVVTRVVDREVEGVVRVEVEEVGGCGVGVAWQPRDGGVVCVAGPGEGVSVFERNGLRHMRNDFRICGGAPVLLEWSCDSLCLAVVGREALAEVGIYVRSNYRWYRKQCLRVGGRVVDVRWDVEKSGLVHVVDERGVVASFTLRMSHVGAVVGGRGRVVVVDGDSLLVTDFRKGIIPPPMAHKVVKASTAVTGVAFEREGDFVVAVVSSGGFERLALASKGEQLVEESKSCWKVDRDGLLRFPVVLSQHCVLAVETATGDRAEECVAMFSLNEGDDCASCIAKCKLPGTVMALSLSDTNVLVAALSSGFIIRMLVSETGSLRIVSRIKVAFAAACAVSVEEISVAGRSAVLVHDEGGCLAAVDVTSETSISLTSECTSFCVSGKYLVFTTRSHVLQSVPLTGAPKSVLALLFPEEAALQVVEANDFNPITTGLMRPIDRGSVIVCSLPSDVRIVLQAPRGNLETVAPRPLILAEVWRLAKAREYGAAFRLSRQQRIDMNIMVEADPDEFLRSVDQLLEEVPDPSHLSVFLTYLRADDEPRMNAVCGAVVDAIDRLADEEKSAKFTSTILTALVRRQPPRFDAALKRVQNSFVRSEEEGQSALDFLLVLSKDEETLYQEALGSYDIKLALMVAKASQLDPVDYSNELRMLQGMDENHRRYTIDVKLERYDLALHNLYACGAAERDACLTLTREHCLFPAALKLFAKDVPAMRQLRCWFAVHLASEDRHAEAAVMFVGNQQFGEAATAYRDAGIWRLALSSFRMERKDDDVWHSFADSVADSLSEVGRARDAASVRWNMLHDLEGALDELVGAQEWLAAFETAAAAGSGRERVVSDLVEAAKVHSSDLSESAGKLHERTARLVAVRETKERMRVALGRPGNGGPGGEADSDAFSATTSGSSLGSYGSDMTFASSMATAQTKTSLYSSIGRGEGKTKEAKIAEKSRKKGMSRKRVRAGHPKEEEALLLTLKRLVPNEFLRRRLGETLTALAHGGEECTQVALELVGAVEKVMERCSELPEDVAATDFVQEALRDRSWYLPVYASL